MIPNTENKIERLLSKNSPWNISCRSLFRSLCDDCWYYAMVEKDKLEVTEMKDLVPADLASKVNTSAVISASLILILPVLLVTHIPRSNLYWRGMGWVHKSAKALLNWGMSIVYGVTFLFSQLPIPQYTAGAFKQSYVIFEERRKALQKSSLHRHVLDFVNKGIAFLHS